MYESKRRERKKGTEYLVGKLNALNLERSKDGEIYPRYHVVNFTSGQMAVITLLIGLSFMTLAGVIIGIASSSGVIGVLSVVAMLYLIACGVLSLAFATRFLIGWLYPAENVIEISYSDKEMHFLSDKIAEAQQALGN